jgi:hypothetical protein
MKIENMISNKGNQVPNQFIITEEGKGALGNFIKRETFQSYASVIAVITTWAGKVETKLDEKYWNYSVTTGKYRNSFLGETKKETENKIKNGEYLLVNLN